MFGSQRLSNHVKLVVIYAGAATIINALVAAVSHLWDRNVLIEFAENFLVDATLETALAGHLTQVCTCKCGPVSSVREM